MPNEYELKPQHDARKSFYGKARVRVDDDGNKFLISYGTPVMYWDAKTKTLHRLIAGWTDPNGKYVTWSSTTGRLSAHLVVGGNAGGLQAPAEAAEGDRTGRQRVFRRTVYGRDPLWGRGLQSRPGCGKPSVSGPHRNEKGWLVGALFEGGLFYLLCRKVLQGPALRI